VQSWLADDPRVGLGTSALAPTQNIPTTQIIAAPAQSTQTQVNTPITSGTPAWSTDNWLSGFTPYWNISHSRGFTGVRTGFRNTVWSGDHRFTPEHWPIQVSGRANLGSFDVSPMQVGRFEGGIIGLAANASATSGTAGLDVSFPIFGGRAAISRTVYGPGFGGHIGAGVQLPSMAVVPLKRLRPFSGGRGWTFDWERN